MPDEDDDVIISEHWDPFAGFGGHRRGWGPCFQLFCSIGEINSFDHHSQRKASNRKAKLWICWKCWNCCDRCARDNKNYSVWTFRVCRNRNFNIFIQNEVRRTQRKHYNLTRRFLGLIKEGCCICLERRSFRGTNCRWPFGNLLSLGIRRTRFWILLMMSPPGKLASLLSPYTYYLLSEINKKFQSCFCLRKWYRWSHISLRCDIRFKELFVIIPGF